MKFAGKGQTGGKKIGRGCTCQTYLRGGGGNLGIVFGERGKKKPGQEEPREDRPKRGGGYLLWRG